MNIFNQENYKDIVIRWVKSKNNGGHGQYRKIAGFLGLSTVMISQIFKGTRDISLDHAFKLTQFLGLQGQEKKYFLLLVERERAASYELKSYFGEQIKTVREEAENLKKIMPQEKKLTEQEKAIFHSNWYYSAVRLQASIDSYNSLESIARGLGLPLSLVNTVIEFLLNQGLMKKENGQLTMGPNRIHLESNSPYVITRQKTWRVKAFEKMDLRRESDLYFTGPMSISEELRQNFRKEITELLKSLSDKVVDCKPDHLSCLNIDFFKLT